MNRKRAVLARDYPLALQRNLAKGPQASMESARSLGRRALALGMGTLDVAKIHERALIALVLPSHSPITRAAMVRQAGLFFAEAITPIEETHVTAQTANADLNRMIGRLSRRSKDLAASNRQLKKEISRRKTVERALRKSEQHFGLLFEKSRHLQDQLRHLSRQLLTAQEEERKVISRELHDEIAQTLTGINVRLAALKSDAAISTRGLQKKISDAQRLVVKSVDIVHRFARELRPTLLDDLGLIPALHSFVKGFAKSSRIRVHLTVFAGIEQSDSAKRTVLYRVAQEALTNVAKHARATRVSVDIRKISDAICMKIKDNGKSFQVQRVLLAKGNNRLGLLGMRERVEMVGGRFDVRSAPGKGTTIIAQIPLNGVASGGGGNAIN